MPLSPVCIQCQPPFFLFGTSIVTNSRAMVVLSACWSRVVPAHSRVCSGFLVVPQRQRLLLCGAWLAVVVTWCQVILSVVVGSVFGTAPPPLVIWGRRPWDATHLWSLYSACPAILPCSTPGQGPPSCGVVPRWFLCLGGLLSGSPRHPLVYRAYRPWRPSTVVIVTLGFPHMAFLARGLQQFHVSCLV